MGNDSLISTCLLEQDKEDVLTILNIHSKGMQVS